MVWHVDTAKYMESSHKTLGDTMAAEMDRNVRKASDLAGIVSMGLAAAAGIGIVGPPPLASQHY
jgi:epoxyqueuosine reductase QueG